MIPLDVKLNEDYFWIEQQYGCSFPFTCKDGIVNFLMEESTKPEDEQSTDSKVYRKLKEKFNGKHIVELNRGIEVMRPFMKIKNYFVCEQFERHEIFKYRREPKRTLEHIKDLQNHLKKAEESTNWSYGGISKEVTIAIYMRDIASAKEYIKDLPNQPAYIKAKSEYFGKVILPMMERHGITYGINNVVEFS